MPAVLVRTDQLAKARALTGITTDAHLAREMGVDRATVGRVLAGQQRPGAAFIAGALLAFPALAFADLFEIDSPAKAPA